MSRPAMLVVATLVTAGCGRQFLGAPLPASCPRAPSACRSELVERGWENEPPEVSIGWFTGAEAVGSRIRIGVDLIARFDSEAELAGILAHEIAHVEARGDAGLDVNYGIDDESAADERAVTLLVLAGYRPDAFASSLTRFIDFDTPDQSHPPLAERIHRAHLATEQLPAGGDDRRAALLAAIDGRAIETTSMIALDGSPQRWLTFWNDGPADEHGPMDPTRALVVLPERGIVIGPPNLGAPSPIGKWQVQPVSRRGAAAIAETLVNPHGRVLAVGSAIVGTAPPIARSSLDREIRNATDEIASIGDDAAVAVIETPAGGVVVTFEGVGGQTTLERWLVRFRRPTAAERLHSAHRIRLETATRTAPLGELVASCPDPTLAAEFEGGDRIIRAGEQFKCVVRRAR
jgi:hypothetical protein